MAGESKTTTNHDEIRKWAESRGGKPATVTRTESGGEPGVLRIDFPGYSGKDSLEEISWEEFFNKFDEKNLAFLYQDKTSSGEESRFFNLVTRDTAEHKSHGSSETAHKSEHKDSDTAHKAADSGHKDKAKNSTHKASDKGEQKTEHKASGKTHKS
jgi:hypothetical protein